MQHRLHRKFQDITGVERVPHIILRGTVGAAQIAGVLWIEQTGRCKGPNTAVRDFVKSVAVGVVCLEHAWYPLCELMLERSDHAVVVGHCFRAIFGDQTESRVVAGKNRRTGAWLAGE